MKDDSLSDVAFCNTKEGMHIRAKELGMKAYSLGCSCPDCNEGFARMIDSVGKQEPDPLLAKHEPALNVYAKQIWNDAIEAAAKCVEQASRDGPYQAIVAHREIRKLKK